MLIFLYRIRDKNITVKEKRIDVYKMPLKKIDIQEMVYGVFSVLLSGRTFGQ